MVTALITALLGNYNMIHLPVFDDSLTFWMETIAVESFGFAWLIKAELFFKISRDQSILMKKGL